MIEPTESENLAEIDRFIDAMIAIRHELDAIIAGEQELTTSPLRRAPHTARSLTENWDRPYSRAVAVFPTGGHRFKYWPPVTRIDQARGDKNLVCSCPPITAYDSDDQHV